MYNYWLTNSWGSKAENIRKGYRKENFCHFWRVVAFWAPMVWLRDNVVLTRWFAVLTALVAVGLLVLAFIASDGFRNFMVILGAVTLILAAVAGIGYLVYRFWPRKWNRPIGRFFETVGPWVLAAWLLFLVGAFLYALWTDFGWWTIGIVAAFVVGVVLVTIAFVFVADFVNGKRALYKRRQEERKRRYLDGEITLDEYIGRTTRKPGRISKFFSGVGDFMVFIVQVVRTKKWKICPTVEIQD